MGNIYRLNSLFELEINQYPGSLTLSKSLLERSSAFEYLFLIISNQNDYTILSEPVSDELIEYWGENKISHGSVTTTNNPYFAKELPLEKKILASGLIEWGNTSILNHEKFLLEKEAQVIFHSNFINSKVNQTRWKEAIKLNKVKTVICVDKFELEHAISSMNVPLVIKSEFSFAGRGNLILKSKIDIKEIGKRVEKIFKENPKGILVEEWVEEDRIQDFSGLFELSTETTNLIAITEMLVDKSGVYRGSMIQKNFDQELADGLQEVANNSKSFTASYFGPISIDGFRFNKGDKVEIQHMSEINFRYSMGRILSELHSKIGTDNESCALLFFPVKNKVLEFQFLVSSLNKIEREFNVRILILTPLTQRNKKKYPFLGFYLSSKSKFSADIFESIKNLLI